MYGTVNSTVHTLPKEPGVDRSLPYWMYLSFTVLFATLFSLTHCGGKSVSFFWKNPEQNNGDYLKPITFSIAHKNGEITLNDINLLAHPFGWITRDIITQADLLGFESIEITWEDGSTMLHPIHLTLFMGNTTNGPTDFAYHIDSTFAELVDYLYPHQW